MMGKNPLWVAKQHGHSIATMLRAYAAWADGTAEVDVEAIKRSINASEAPPAISLAVNLSVADALQTRRALPVRPTRISAPCANRLFSKGKVEGESNQGELAGVAGFELRMAGSNFADEFPDYRFRTSTPTGNNVEASIKPETCNEVVDRFIAYCELRVSKDDMAPRRWKPTKKCWIE